MKAFYKKCIASILAISLSFCLVSPTALAYSNTEEQTIIYKNNNLITKDSELMKIAETKDANFVSLFSKVYYNKYFFRHLIIW